MADIGIDMNRLTREQREALQQIADDHGETLEQAANRVIGRETKRRYLIPALRRTVTPFRRTK